MGDSFIFFLVVLILMAIVTKETFVVGLLYLFVGARVLGNWWSDHVIQRIAFTRSFDRHAFPEETVPVEITITNRSWLPAVWLRVQDFFPIEIAESRSFQQVLSLGPRESTTLRYNLKTQKRGYYPVGPLNITSGDLLGMSQEKMSEGASDHLTVYPRVVGLRQVNLPSRSPMGSLRARQPLHEDPARPAGKRDYQPGDSLRRIDWKASAVTNRLQTKLFESSIALETMLLLNLNAEEYPLRARFEATELAITVTASLANWIVGQRQSVGLITNGLDPLAVDNQVIPLPARKGRPQLMRIFEVLARVRAFDTTPFHSLVNQQRTRLNWGTSLIIVTPSADQALFDQLVPARRTGLLPMLIFCGENSENRKAMQMSKLLHIPVAEIHDEKDLDQWRQAR